MGEQSVTTSYSVIPNFKF